MNTKIAKRGVLAILAAGLAMGGAWWGTPTLFEAYTGVSNPKLTYDSSQTLSAREFEKLAADLTHEARKTMAEARAGEEDEPFAKRLKLNMLMNTRSLVQKNAYPHIEHFRKAGIRRYEGPATCLTCHESFKVEKGDGKVAQVHTLHDVVESVHFKFQQTAPGFTTYGYDGREVNAEGTRPIPVGKIDRACGVPGTFSWLGWAELIKSKPAHANGETVLRSEGCGQCHIGGTPHPATEKMMPVGDVPAQAKEGIDCLICHSRTYDMNQRVVIDGEGGRRWNQDRSMAAALTVGLPERENCLFCHQHNLGGDTFADNVAAKNLGYRNQRILHAGAKRATPFSPATDVHAAAGMVCTDCHVPEGHKIPRGTHGTDLVANDLPGKVVSCESCHTAAPHTKGEDRALMNGHVGRLTCEACHIRRLEETSVVLRDWIHPTWNAEEGLWEPTDIYRSGKPGEGVVYLWFNGSGTFLANALGDYPLGGDRYNPLMEQMVTLADPDSLAAIREQVEKLKGQYPDLDVEDYIAKATRPLTQLTPEQREVRARWIEEKIRPLMKKGTSRIAPFKVFNAYMYEDLNNEGPFGAMILPFDYPSYYEGGDPQASVVKAVSGTMVKRMYEAPFKLFMMDEFMRYFGVQEWSGKYPLQDGKLVNVEPRWMRQMGTLMVNHGIQSKGHVCKACHAKSGGLIDFDALGYPPERIKDLRNLPELG